MINWNIRFFVLLWNKPKWWVWDLGNDFKHFGCMGF